MEDDNGEAGSRSFDPLVEVGLDVGAPPEVVWDLVRDPRRMAEWSPQVRSSSLVDAMTRSLLAEDPDALVAPYTMSGGTDAKHFRKLGMRSYGFAPLRLPADLDFTALFHGVDERVPVDALEFGARVFDRFLDQV